MLTTNFPAGDMTLTSKIRKSLAAGDKTAAEVGAEVGRQVQASLSALWRQGHVSRSGDGYGYVYSLTLGPAEEARREAHAEKERARSAAKRDGVSRDEYLRQCADRRAQSAAERRLARQQRMDARKKGAALRKAERQQEYNRKRREAAFFKAQAAKTKAVRDLPTNGNANAPERANLHIKPMTSREWEEAGGIVERLPMWAVSRNALKFINARG